MSNPEFDSTSGQKDEVDPNQITRHTDGQKNQESQHYHTTSHNTESLESCIRHRHSIRFYLPKEVDPDLIHRCLKLAQLAPSNSNIQNWRLFLATGAAKDRIVKALQAAAEQGDPVVPPLPDGFKHFRSELGKHLYGPDGYGIDRSDKEGHRKAVLRNFEFFGAPVIAIIAQDPSLTPVDALSAGLYLQTLLLAFTEQGLGTCLEVSVTGYPDVLKKEFGTDLAILCGIAIGWPDPNSKVNKLMVGRNEVDKNVKWLTE